MKTVNFIVFVLFVKVCFAQTVSEVPDRTPDNLIVASYNIKWIGQQRHDFEKLAQVISRFDICGILEVKKESSIVSLTQEIETLTSEDWGYVYGFRTHRPGGNYHEAFAVIFRRDRVQLGDGLISNLWDKNETYRNDPYFVSFTSGNFDFTLFLIHTRWSDDDDGSRSGEVNEMANQIQFTWSVSDERDIILLGDFNYPGDEEVMTNMARQIDFEQVDDNPKTTFKSNYSGYASAYDHIFLSREHTSDTEYVDGSAQALDVTRLIYGSNSKRNMKKSKKKLSDHLPVFAVFRTNLEDDD